MKLSVFDRVLLALLLIIAIVFSFVLFGMAANLIPEDMVTGFISLFYYAWQNALILAGVGLVLLAISIKLLFAGRGAKAPAQPTTALIRQSEIGGAFITLPAIDSMVQRHCRAQARVRDCYSTVRAAEDGTVDQVQAWDGRTKTGMQSYGNMVRIRHADYGGKSLQTRYAHLSSYCVKQGEQVREGQLIGYTGQTGNVYGAHLHFEVIWGGVRRNPLVWLDDDFTTATGKEYTYGEGEHAVVRPAEEEEKAMEQNQLQKLCIVDASDNILASAREKGLPVEQRTCWLIGPASSGDAMDLWQQSQAEGRPYFASTTEV